MLYGMLESLFGLNFALHGVCMANIKTKTLAMKTRDGD